MFCWFLNSDLCRLNCFLSFLFLSTLAFLHACFRTTMSQCGQRRHDEDNVSHDPGLYDLSNNKLVVEIWSNFSHVLQAWESSSGPRFSKFWHPRRITWDDMTDQSAEVHEFLWNTPLVILIPVNSWLCQCACSVFNKIMWRWQHVDLCSFCSCCPCCIYCAVSFSPV